MDTAWCTLDEREYTAHKFGRLGPSYLAEHRRHLTCTGCGNRAFFRARSRDGRAACFGSNDHHDDCDYVAPPSRSTAGGPDRVEDELWNPGDRIKIDLLPADGADVVHGDAGSNPDGVTTPRHGATGDDFGVVRRATSHRRLRGLLRDLARSSAFRSSDQVISLASFPELPVRTFFVSFDKIKDEELEGEKRGFWGTLVDARRDKRGDLWLNSGTPNEPSVVLGQEFVDAFLETWGIDDLEDLAGAHVLVLGTFWLSHGGKRYVGTESPQMLAVRFAG